MHLTSQIIVAYFSYIPMQNTSVLVRDNHANMQLIYVDIVQFCCYHAIYFYVQMQDNFQHN